MTDFAERRRGMVERQIAGRRIRDLRVLNAMRSVRREAFVPEVCRDRAYEDTPLSIACGQTISQPYIVAFMVQALELEAGDRVLEIGTGSGYAAAVLASIAEQVYTIERHAELATTARDRLTAEGFHNVQVLHADGTLGWSGHAPFDAIAVTAAGPEPPASLLAQLARGGRLVVPVGGDPEHQALVRVTCTGRDAYRHENLGPVRFVPLIGEQGWGGSGASGSP